MADLEGCGFAGVVDDEGWIDVVFGILCAVVWGGNRADAWVEFPDKVLIPGFVAKVGRRSIGTVEELVESVVGSAQVACSGDLVLAFWGKPTSEYGSRGRCTKVDSPEVKYTSDVVVDYRGEEEFMTSNGS